MCCSVCTRPRPLDPNGGFRIGVFDTSVLTSDITAVLKRGKPSSVPAGMRYGTLRGFIPHYVWAEVPLVLADRKNEGGDFNLVKAERLWWGQHVPLLQIVCANGLPVTAAADKRAQEDLSDVGILQLADVLDPVAAMELTSRSLIERPHAWHVPTRRPPAPWRPPPTSTRTAIAPDSQRPAPLCPGSAWRPCSLSPSCSPDTSCTRGPGRTPNAASPETTCTPPSPGCPPARPSR
ncbi:hypothetical protein ABZT28_16905 [Streptomyces sp. NPDC005388]|uniref:hypothetical protein n=1 Tax=Streptomyces sp. NPDC005388 TaxID=3156717 RepID=UPI0033A034B3